MKFALIVGALLVIALRFQMSLDDLASQSRNLYLFGAALFLVLLAASLWIARVNWREDATQHTGVHVTTWVCRVLIGCQWFQGCLWKLPLPVSGGFEY